MVRHGDAAAHSHLRTFPIGHKSNLLFLCVEFLTFALSKQSQHLSKAQHMASEGDSGDKLLVTVNVMTYWILQYISVQGYTCYKHTRRHYLLGSSGVLRSF
jgi:hypothetical protein